MSIVTEITRLQNAKSSLKSSIEAKGVTVASDATLDAYPALVDSIPSGGGADDPELDDVIFIDWDGSLVAHYSAQEFLALTEMPENPTREGYISQGWNYTLADAKTIVQETGDLVIGQLYAYINADNDTKVYITLDDPEDKEFTLCVAGNTLSSEYSVDWGDNTVEQFSGNSFQVLIHTYQSTGDFIIKLASSSGGVYFPGGYSQSNICGQAYTPNGRKITGIVIGPNVSAIYSLAYQCYNIKFIRICSSVIFGHQNYGNLFNSSANIKEINIPAGSTVGYSSGFNSLNGPLAIILPRLQKDYMTISYSNTIRFISGGANYSSISSNLSLKRFVTTQNCTANNLIALERLTIAYSTTYPSSYAVGVSNDSYKNNKVPIKKLNVLQSVTSIPQFNNCSFDALDFSSTSITDAYFSCCENLKVLRLPNTVTTLYLAGCDKLKSLTLPQDLTTVSNYCFYKGGLERFDASNTDLTTIGDYAFYYCKCLSEIVFPNTLTTIGEYALANVAVSELVLPATVTNIGRYCFQNCYGLVKLTILAETPPTAGSGIFSDGYVPVIYVPAASVEDYKGATGWLNYASKIQAMPTS